MSDADNDNATPASLSVLPKALVDQLNHLFVKLRHVQSQMPSTGDIGLRQMIVRTCHQIDELLSENEMKVTMSSEKEWWEERRTDDTTSSPVGWMVVAIGRDGSIVCQHENGKRRRYKIECHLDNDTMHDAERAHR